MTLCAWQEVKIQELGNLFTVTENIAPEVTVRLMGS